MKGAVLTDGFGMPLLFLTRMVDKKPLPVHDRPTVCHPAETLRPRS
jgi:dTDP-glucose pyrophosphorylase